MAALPNGRYTDGNPSEQLPNLLLKKPPPLSHFQSIENFELLFLFRKFSERGILPLLQYHDVILRNDSEFSVAERELIAAYVSSVIGCHTAFRHFGIIPRFGASRSKCSAMRRSIWITLAFRNGWARYWPMRVG